MRRELSILAAALSVGLLVLPGLVYAVGHATLGAYSAGSGSAGRFYADYFAGLTQGGVIFWVVALGPYVFVWMGRLLLRVYRGQ